MQLDVSPFFAGRGVTVTTVGMFGGMTYENPQIQAAIDPVFVAQQQKEVNKARLEAQQSRLEAKGSADAKVIAAEGEAAALSKVSAAVRDAGPAVFQMRQLEIERDRVQRWDGRHPTYLFTSGGATPPSLMLQVPTPPDALAGAADVAASAVRP